MSSFESVVEEAAIEYLVELGYDYIHGPDIAPDGTSPERTMEVPPFGGWLSAWGTCCRVVQL